ncbi:unnamed protein product [Peronospora belbahrii]|uniref:Uncharacterized protein n=1 Tax=Peronospora belbahrii TaxID=622444 RepID=A0ABN8CR70_9STRA|nr:unnamed protein product [Peronospora belbahrii]
MQLFKPQIPPATMKAFSAAMNAVATAYAPTTTNAPAPAFTLSLGGCTHQHRCRFELKWRAASNMQGVIPITMVASCEEMTQYYKKN